MLSDFRAAHSREKFTMNFTAQPVPTKGMAPRISRISRISESLFNAKTRRREVAKTEVKGVRQNSSKVGASRCDARTAQRAVPTKEMKNFVSHPEATLCAFAPLRLCVKRRKGHSGKSRISDEIPGVPICRKNQEVRGMFGRGMEEGVLRTIPLTLNPLTSLRLFPSSLLHPTTSLWSQLCRAAMPPRSLRRGIAFLAALGFCCGGGQLRAAEVTPHTVLKAMERAADWQLANPTANADRLDQAAGDAGFMALAGISGDPKYRDAMLAMGGTNNWKLGAQSLRRRRPLHRADLGGTLFSLPRKQDDCAVARKI